jgi:hypothetical protein
MKAAIITRPGAHPVDAAAFWPSCGCLACPLPAHRRPRGAAGLLVAAEGQHSAEPIKRLRAPDWGQRLDITKPRARLSAWRACIERPFCGISRFESFRQDLGADRAGHCFAKSQVVALGEVDPIHPFDRHNFASVEKRNLKEPAQVAIVLSQLG